MTSKRRRVLFQTCASSSQGGSSKTKGDCSFSETAIIRRPLFPRTSCFPDDILRVYGRWPGNVPSVNVGEQSSGFRKFVLTF